MNHIQKITLHIRKAVKLTMLVFLSAIVIITAVALLYKPTYAVYFGGELIGYTENKSRLQERINSYMESGDKEGVAFAQVDAMPEYTLCLLKKDIVSNDDEIYSKVTENGTEYYHYYAITDEKKEKVYVATFEEAEKIVKSLKEKNSQNKNDLGIVEKYDTKTKEFTSVEKSISKLYEEPPKVTYVASTSSGYVSGASYSKVDIGISLIQPISGIITSRFGSRESIRTYGHRGLDIAAPTGTPIKAAAAGTVTTSGYNSSYGYMVIINHGNGVETVYGHCSQLIATVGQKVSQGQVIAKVGSTGNSTGPHLHLEVRVNSVLQNPQNYVY